MKKILIILFILLIAIIIIWNTDYMNNYKCKIKKGRIVNTLSSATCMENEKSIGPITGMRCPCICCVTK